MASQLRRDGVAREVHDGLAQELAFIASHAQRLDCTGADAAIVTQIQNAAQRALLEARVTIEVLRAPEDAPLGLLVERAVAVFRARYRVTVELHLVGDLAVDAAPRAALLRILGQAMTNAVTHGRASRVTVRLGSHRGESSLRIHDDGRGFDVARAGRGWGLAGMRERAELIGGRFAVVSRAGCGTTVEVTFP
jgi:signal transduction histidine kinase